MLSGLSVTIYKLAFIFQILESFDTTFLFHNMYSNYRFPMCTVLMLCLRGVVMVIDMYCDVSCLVDCHVYIMRPLE